MNFTIENKVLKVLAPMAAAAFLAGSAGAIAGGDEAPTRTPAAENAQGWVQDPEAVGTPNDEPLPRGLWISGDNGRADNGRGNGGESGREGNTPNGDLGEDGDNLDPPNGPKT